jgi:hypothetical protein
VNVWQFRPQPIVTLPYFLICGISTDRLQNQVDEVVDIMQSNIGKVMERGEKLEDLQDKSGWHISCRSL